MNKIMDFVSNGIPFRVRIIEQGDKFGLNDCLVNRNSVPIVQFFDRRFNFSENGQFISSYYISTLINDNKKNGLCLQGGVPDWTISAASMTLVVSWLKEIANTVCT
jgi:hypothetical protein